MYNHLRIMNYLGEGHLKDCCTFAASLGLRLLLLGAST
jgi:hypothetical protein